MINQHIEKCKAIGLQEDLKEDEFEIFEASSTEDSVGEEDDGDIDLETANFELERMKRRIQELSISLKLEEDECRYANVCTDVDIDVPCAGDNELCELQRDNYKLKCKICELAHCCRATKAQIKGLRATICDKAKEILGMQKTIAMLNTFKLGLEHHYGLCIERFEHIKHVKCEWSDCVDMINETKQCQKMYENTFVQKKCYIIDIHKFGRQIYDTKMFCHTLHDWMLDNIKLIQEHVGAQNMHKLSIDTVFLFSPENAIQPAVEEADSKPETNLEPNPETN